MPLEDLAFIASFEDWIVSATICSFMPGSIPACRSTEQKPGKLRWIREPFLSHGGEHGHVVVHGHSIAKEPVLRRNRIGIDTGAYASGRLTALGLEGTQRWLIQTADNRDTVSIETASI